MSVFVIINPEVKRNCLQEIQNLAFNTHEVVIREKKRGNNQNALYWKWIGVISHVVGYSPDDLHEAFKRNFLGEDEIVDVFGKKILIPRSSAKLKKKEFSEYMAKVEAFAHTQGILLPSPDYYGYEGR